MATLGGRPRWVPHDKHPADALTIVEGAHFAPMAKLLNTSKFCIKEEAEDLLEGKQAKKNLGYVPRPRSAPGTSQQSWEDPEGLAPGEEEFELDRTS